MSVKTPSLQAARGLAIIGVIIIHSQWLMTAPSINEVPWIGYIVNQLSRFAVPVFFVLAGYFFYPKLADKGHYRRNNIYSDVFKYCLPIIALFIVWSLIYLLLPFNLGVLIESGYIAERQGYWGYWVSLGINAWLEGGLVVLWYLPGLVCAIIIISIFHRYWIFIWAVALALYTYGLAGGSYAIHTGIEIEIFTRNGPFMSTFMVLMGMQLRRSSLSLPLSISFLVVGILGHMGEAYWLFQHGVEFNSHDFLIMSPLWGIGIVATLLHYPQLGNTRILQYLGNESLGIYLVHIYFVIVLTNLIGFFPLLQPWVEYISIPFVLGMSILFIEITKRTPLSFVLLRQPQKKRFATNTVNI